MANNYSGNCGCGTRIISQGVENQPERCIDVCANPICGDPSVLSLMAPLIYDEIGINLCTTFPLGTDISTTYPTAAKASIQVIDASYSYGAGNVEISNIVGRPNCYQITLSNLTLTFAMNIYDTDCRLLDTIFPTAVYLPPQTTAPTYNEDTNPTAVTLEIFAPYGLSFNATDADPTFALNYVGFESENNSIRQGLNLFTLPKLLGFDTTDDTATVGITFILQSLYYAGYRVNSAGKIPTPKGSIISPDDTDCLRFVAGELLDLAIRPLQLGPPACEQNLKNDLSTPPTCGNCNDTGCPNQNASSGNPNGILGNRGLFSANSGCGCKKNRYNCGNRNVIVNLENNNEEILER